MSYNFHEIHLSRLILAVLPISIFLIYSLFFVEYISDYVSLESIRSLIRRLRKILDKDFIQIVIDTGYIFKNL